LFGRDLEFIAIQANAVAIALAWHDPLLHSEDGFHLTTFVILVLFPCLLLLAEFALLWWLARVRHRDT
jgi:hypothetical protein